VWPEHSFSVMLDQALVVAMEDQARWIIARDLAGDRRMPDFMSNICEKALEAVKPEAVNLIR
ncbi:MAG TPA: nitrate ABC transporter substrate-binding protein, partial [Anaerolineae bacterium]|nr:nitrate ABC transporter substrate-binding protein [Anaerolineae bacterium]